MNVAKIDFQQKVPRISKGGKTIAVMPVTTFTFKDQNPYCIACCMQFAEMIIL